jgi:hypothetical protein
LFVREVDKMAKVNEKRDVDYKTMKKRDTQMRENMTSRGARRKKMREGLKSEEKKVKTFNLMSVLSLGLFIT